MGENDGLQCTTNSTTCCRNTNQENLTGEFYFPNGTIITTDSTNGYYVRKRSGHIILEHQGTTLSGEVTGQFRCNISESQGKVTVLLINIGEFS